MDVIEALTKRYSCRAFRDDPVDKETLRKVVEAALKSPSWANTQPWEVYIAAGKSMARLRKGYVDNMEKGIPRNPDFPAPEAWPEHMKKRTDEMGKKRLDFLGIARDDKEARKKLVAENYRFFNAPALIVLCLDRQAPNWSFFDLGVFAQSLMLAAQQYGLATIPAFMFVAYPDLLRKELDIPPEQAVVIGIAIGYEDARQPANQVKADRRPLAEVLKIKGV